MAQTFDELVAAQAHQQEITSTRKGGFGGSDAQMFLNIAHKGLDKLSQENLKRIAIAMGLAEQPDHIDNIYTTNGHRFEDEVNNYLLSIFADGLLKEQKMAYSFAKSFNTFAHADFMKGTHVFECKFYPEDTTDQAANRAKAQLQWYYMLGAETVTLIHGIGSHDPYQVREMVSRNIPRNEEIIAELKEGIRILDEAIRSGWQPILNGDTVVPDDLKITYWALADAKRRQAEVEEEIKTLNASIQSYMEENGITKFVGDTQDGETHTVTLQVSNGARKFDSKKFLGTHPEYDLAEFYTTGKGHTSIIFR